MTTLSIVKIYRGNGNAVRKNGPLGARQAEVGSRTKASVS